MLRPWDLKILIRRDGSSVSRQIVQAIIEEIRRGRLLPGTPLPGTRDLARALDLNRKTVIGAFDELTAQGWLVTEGRRGTFVSSELPGDSVVAEKPADARVALQPGFVLRGESPDVSCLYAEDGYFTFDDGAPDTRLAPVSEIAAAWRKALVSASKRNRLGYGDPRGSLVLRREILAMLNSERGLTAAEDNICVVRGSQMGIYIAARVLVRPGDIVVMEALSYPPAREAFRSAGAEVVTVGLDEDGMKIDELERLCRKKRVRAVYVTPHHQFPTTVLLPAARRMRLLALAEQFDFAIIEDDYSHEFHFAHRPMLPLASVDRGGKVVYVGSMSKLLTPSLRVGYLIAPAAFIERAVAEVTIIDRQGDPATEAAVADLLASGEIRSHTKRVVKIYAERRNQLAQLLTQQFGERLAFTLPVGGLALWARFTPEVDMQRLRECAASQRLRFLGAETFVLENQAPAALRLGFGSLNQVELKEGVDRLAQAVAMLQADDSRHARKLVDPCE
ncbi:MocR-like pyridoxine biosynthesis transcription factor PdxR [Silvimonas amylolytica]|uniref:Putative 8-amino-7-oxononanoate synthase n=1 Tax=Silvimonas amylolytica TaxID=449663 RepID=A0ABQ2PIW1_9NEIS|nr:PLP-dependent aminotransferase family protein [Silvimonas amylolytica]GGP25298.1 GntR family transcriptional regulator [Silvimonas amylolytica]